MSNAFGVNFEAVCSYTRYLTVDASVVVDDSGHLPAAWFSPITGGAGLGPVYDEDESCCTVGMGPSVSLAIEASTEELTSGRKEHESEATCDKVDNAATARLTENSDLTGAYIGDLTIAVFVTMSIDCEH